MQLGLNLAGMGPRPPAPMPLAPQGGYPQQAQPQMTPGGYPRPINVGGLLRIQSAGAVLAAAQQANDTAYAAQQAQVELSGLAGYIKRCWEQAKQAKLIPEKQMLDAMRARRGEYNPDQMQMLAQQQGSMIFMMITATKCRGAGALMRDVLVGTGSDKGWTLTPTPVAELPDDVTQQIIQGVAQEVMATEQIQGNPVDEQVIADRLRQLKDDVTYMLEQEAKARCDRMEKKMEDQLLEGGYLDAMNDFIDDMTTFKTACIQGPIIRRKPTLQWTKMPDGTMQATPVVKLVKEWRRVDPFMLYPAPWASNIQDAWLIHRHKLTRGSLTSMIGVEAYSEVAIRKVLELYGTGGLHDWLQIDSERAFVEGKNQTSFYMTDTIDAIQFVGPISGQMLLDWGMSRDQIPDPAKEYHADVWMIGPHIIKAALNSDPLGRRNYYATSYEPIPGAFWGNSLYDLIRDCQDMCNSTARALANNLGISSGPQVGVNVDRLPVGENITQMYPWKIWQFTSDPMGNTTQPAMQFFQPQSNAQELLMVFDRFSTLADEYSGVPRYMTGQEGTPGAGRTASGLSMMIGNASKIIKQTVSFVDNKVTVPLLEMLYYYNMVYEDDPDLKGDVCVKARGVLALVQKETAAVRRAEFLQTTMNPVDMQIMGVDGRAYLLREMAMGLDLNADKVIPSVAALKRRQLLQAAAQATAAAAGAGQMGGGQPGGGQPPAPGGGQQLMNGAPVTDHFSPVAAG